MANQTKRKLRRILANRWRKMIRRCENPKSPDYVRYGGRGISVCAAWRCKDSGLASFIDHVSSLPLPQGMSLDAALAMRGPKHLSLDRVDNDSGYEPGNVRWATPLQQSANQRRTVFVAVNRVTMPRTDAARAAGVNPKTAAHRERLGYARTDAVSLGIGGRTATTRRSRDQLLLAMIKAGVLLVDEVGFVFIKGIDGWQLAPLGRSGAGRYLGVSITVPAQFDHLTPHRQAGGAGPYRSMFSHARVVALFHHRLPDAEHYYEVDHINTDPQDDRPCNLRWRRPVDHRANAHQDRVRQSSDAVQYRDPTLQPSALKAVIAAVSAQQPSPSVVEELPLPQNLDDSAVIQLLRAVKAGAGFDQSLWAHQQYWDLLTAILASRSNNASCTGGEVYIDCKSQTGQVLRRVPVIQLTTSDRVFHGCLLCHRQSWSPRIEIRNRLRYPNTPCASCQALDLQRPDLAKLIAPDPPTGIKQDPSRITSGSNQFCHFRCREAGCSNVVRRKVKSLAQGRELPVCEACRKRGKNFRGSSGG